VATVEDIFDEVIFILWSSHSHDDQWAILSTTHSYFHYQQLQNLGDKRPVADEIRVWYPRGAGLVRKGSILCGASRLNRIT
jgi:hypothetical protein